MVLCRKRKPRIRWKRSTMLKSRVKDELIESNFSTIPSSNGREPGETWSDADALVSMQRRALTNDVSFHLTTQIRELHQLITSTWTPGSSPNENVNPASNTASAQQRLLHRLQLTRGLYDVIVDILELCKDESIDSFTALIVLSLYVLKGVEATMKEIQVGEYVVLEDFPGLRRIPNILPPYSAWDHLKGVLRISAAFFALPQSLLSHFELLDPMEFKTQTAPLPLDNQFTAELVERHVRYKAVQAILLKSLEKRCSLNQLLILLDDLCRFQHLSLKSAILILVAFLTTGGEATSTMISLGVAVDCSETPRNGKLLASELWISPMNKQRRANVLLHTFKFLRVEERFRLGQVSTAARQLTRSPLYEELALQEVLWFTSGNLNAWMSDMLLRKGMDLTCKISSWHLLGAMVIGHLPTKMVVLNDHPDLRNWVLRLDGLLSVGKMYLVLMDDSEIYDRYDPVRDKNSLFRVLRDYWMKRNLSPDPPLFTIKALLCDSRWREAILDTRNSSITPVMVLKWACGILAEGSLPDGLPSPSEALRNYPQVTQLDDKQLWYCNVEDESDTKTTLPVHTRFDKILFSHLDVIWELLSLTRCSVELNGENQWRFRICVASKFVQLWPQVQTD